MFFIGDGPFDVFSFREIHSLGDGRRKVDVELFALFAFDELNFSWITHMGVYSHITRHCQQKNSHWRDFV